MSEKLPIKLIYSESYFEAIKTAKELGLKRDYHVVTYGNMKDLKRFSDGLYAEQIYPQWANDLLDFPRPKKDES